MLRVHPGRVRRAGAWARLSAPSPSPTWPATRPLSRDVVTPPPRAGRSVAARADHLRVRCRHERRRCRRAVLGAVLPAGADQRRGCRPASSAWASARRAAAGLYVSAALSHTLNTAGLGRLVVILPALPAAGWAAGALARLARQAATEAAERRAGARNATSPASPACLHPSPTVTCPACPRRARTPTSSRPASRSCSPTRCWRCAGWSARWTASPSRSPTARTRCRAPPSRTSPPPRRRPRPSPRPPPPIEQLAATAGSIAEIAVRVSQFAGSTRRDVDARRAGGPRCRRRDGRHRRPRRVTSPARTEALRERISRVGDDHAAIDEISPSARRSSPSTRRSRPLARASSAKGSRPSPPRSTRSPAAPGRRPRRSARSSRSSERQASDTGGGQRGGPRRGRVGTELQGDVVASLRRITMMVDRTTHAAREITEATRQQRSPPTRS